MVARERRRSPAAPEALILAVVLGLAGTAAIWAARPGADELEAAEGGSAAQEAAPTAPRVLAPVLERDAALEQGIVRIVDRAMERASAESRGKAHAGNSHVSVLVRELGSGRELVALAPDRPLRPASNMKLVTSAAALVLLGPAWQFETRFEAHGDLAGGRLRGDLVVRAGGDPFYATHGDGRVEERLDPVAHALLERGVRRIDGDIVLDRGVFAEPSPAPGWPPPNQHWDDYCALAAGLTLNAGILTASVADRTQAGPLAVQVHPSPHGLDEHYALIAKPGARPDPRVGASRSAVTVRGTLPTSADPWSASFSHPDPEQLLGCVLRDRLARAGIELGGSVRVARGVPAGEPIAVLHSPLLDVLEPINTHSVNSVTDQVFLTAGAVIAGAGTREGGSEATALALERLGVDRTGLIQVDGSGLSRDNRITVRQIAALLDAVLALDDATAGAYLGSLAIAGETGTLEDRMREPPIRGRIHAKTGWISGVSALSGLARPPGRRELVFSIVIEYPQEVGGLNTRCWKPMQDEIAALLIGTGP